ncbi:DUF305 domain-containing protein [Lentzea cavernae]|uniref:DUF305 domain-containing protein n=1 Tax=Lentzea cavernae TaxID=2020703 RepID=A0ABQ3MFW4_9PSEU|nr:DUF305 domain-containing protein [Lentzea cavernae]GHH40113.1 DUF305 domain-containing protein [Lentzea cavernae]
MRALLLAAVLVVTACGSPVDTGVAAPDGLSPTDLAFADLVIPQNESALAALALTAHRPGSALRPVAARVETRYRDELAQVREVLARTGRAESDQHEGHDMPGMITAAELAAVGHAHGADFDLQLKVLLRNQFEEARTVARAELASGTSEPLRELGARIDSTRAEFLELLGGSLQ